MDKNWFSKMVKNRAKKGRKTEIFSFLRLVAGSVKVQLRFLKIAN